MQRQHESSTGPPPPRSPKLIMVQGSSSSKFLFLASLIVLIMLIGFVRESKSENVVQQPIDSEKGPFDCKRLMLRGAKAVMKTISRCGREVKATTTSTKDFADKIACVMKCAMLRSNMTTPDYHVTPSSLKVMMQRFTPNDFILNEIHSYMVQRCKHMAESLDPTDELCHSYAHYAVCLQTGFEDFMNSSPYCIKKPKKNEQT